MVKRKIAKFGVHEKKACKGDDSNLVKHTKMDFDCRRESILGFKNRQKLIYLWKVRIKKII